MCAVAGGSSGPEVTSAAEVRSRLWILLAPASVVAGAIVLYCIIPEKTWWMPPCLFHEFTGLYCPGCGTARGLHRLLHGDVAGAIRLNVLTLAILPLVLYLLADAVRCGLAGPDAKPRPIPPWLVWVFVAAVAVFWIARNIPVYPFTLLAPH